MSPRAPSRAVTQLVMEYLEAHPQACDTIEGIARWWVTSQQVNNTTLVVQQALTVLQAKGYVSEERRIDGRIFYRSVKKS